MNSPLITADQPSDDLVSTIPEHFFVPRPHLSIKQVWPAIETVLLRNASLLDNLDAPPELREGLAGIAAQLRQGAELLQEVCS